ncbi:hypothetical protein CH302_00975 [Rhodococcus sp. 15-2388-1-1a]|uniref:hypothetical protein n=1 Tax=Nocardiaceae TaxID=85025 RepID=UPI00068AF755|nr:MULTISPECIES: hypothetical protein [Rhodococcus]OZF05227.1 hypothetical protein CH302_00975 [Rhodococcus sp. 15-2388-1-1a]
MPREFARIRINIADDEDLESQLPADAQWLFFRVLVPEPSLNYAGVGDWRPKKLLRKANDMTMERLMRAAAHLERHDYALFDDDMEEFMVRTLIRSDELLKNPKMAATVVRGYSETASKSLKAVIVSEIQQAKEEHPDYSSWTYKDTADGLSRLLSKPNRNTVGYVVKYADWITDTDVVPIGNPDAVPIGNRIAVQDGYPYAVENADQASSEIGNRNRSRTPVPAPAYLHQAPLSGYLSTEGHQSDGSETPPSPHCFQHPNGTERACRACGVARVAREDWYRAVADGAARARSTEARDRAELRAEAIVECELCDDDGYAGGRVCDHDPDADDRARRGIELARAALAKTDDA